MRGVRRVRVCGGVAIAALLVVAMWLPMLPAPMAAGPEVRDGGAPAPGSGAARTPPFVRVVDGKTFETTLNMNRTLVSLVGIAVAPANTDCGREATRLLQSLSSGGLQLEEDTAATFDAHNRRVYHALTRDGRPVARELVRAGVARVTAEGEARHRFPTDEAAARASGTGCLWNTNVGASAARAPSSARSTAPAPSGLTRMICRVHVGVVTG